MKLQNINYENMILIYHICRYIMLPLFTSYGKSEICFKYLRMLSRLKAAYIFYFQFSFQEIRIINMYVIIHGSVIIYDAYFKFTGGYELVEHYVPANEVYQNHHFIINNLEIYSKICGICIVTVPSTLW